MKSKKMTAGFTLVELIVVIAILGILAGVGTVGYSGYIKKANMAADQTLISDIEYALQLAGYSNTFTNGDGGYMILSVDGVSGITEGSPLDEAMIAAFGTGYQNSLKLKYSGWGNNGLALGLNGEQAKAVYNSTYYAVSDQLMGQVKEITDAAWSILENTSGEANREQMIAMFADGSMTLEDVAQTYGYESLDDVPDEAMPNLMVLAVAGDVAMKNQADDPEDWTMSGASELIQNFALYNGYASTAAGKTAAEGGSSFADAYSTFVEEISEAEDVSEVAAAYKKLMEVAKADSAYSTYVSGEQSKTDIAAFTAMMSGLTGAAAMNNSGIIDGLSQKDFFTTGLGNSLFNTYIGAVESALALDAEAGEALMGVLENGGVAVFYSVSNSKTNVGNTLPIE